MKRAGICHSQIPALFYYDIMESCEDSPYAFFYLLYCSCLLRGLSPRLLRSIRRRPIERRWKRNYQSLNQRSRPKKPSLPISKASPKRFRTISPFSRQRLIRRILTYRRKISSSSSFLARSATRLRRFKRFPKKWIAKKNPLPNY